MTLTKDRLVENIYHNSNLKQSDSAHVLDSLLETMKQTLSSGEDILISGFGKFCVREKKERRGRNPETGNDMILEARRVVTFRCSEKLKDKVNIKKKKRKKRKSKPVK
jgi:integration host factor subunit alpha